MTKNETKASDVVEMQEDAVKPRKSKSKKASWAPLLVFVAFLVGMLVMTLVQAQKPQNLGSDASTVNCTGVDVRTCNTEPYVKYCKWLPGRTETCRRIPVSGNTCNATSGCSANRRTCTDFNAGNCPINRGCTRHDGGNRCQGSAVWYTCDGRYEVTPGSCVSNGYTPPGQPTNTPAPGQPDPTTPPADFGDRWKLRGRVQNLTGGNLANMLVEVKYANSSVQTFSTNSEGVFSVDKRLSNVPDGRFEVRVMTEGSTQYPPSNTVTGCSVSGVKYVCSSLSAASINSDSAVKFNFRQAPAASPTRTPTATPVPASTFAPQAQISYPAQGANLSMAQMMSNPNLSKIKVTANGDPTKQYDVIAYMYKMPFSQSTNVWSTVTSSWTCDNTRGQWVELSRMRVARGQINDWSNATIELPAVNWDQVIARGLNPQPGMKYLINVNVVSTSWREDGLNNSVCTGSPAKNPTTGKACFSNNWCNFDGSNSYLGMFKVVTLKP